MGLAYLLVCTCAQNVLTFICFWVCHMFEQWHGHICVDVASVLVSNVHLVSCCGAGFVQTLPSLDVKDDGKNPVAALSTLILLSYNKILHTIVTSLSSTELQYKNYNRLFGCTMELFHSWKENTL